MPDLVSKHVGIPPQLNRPDTVIKDKPLQLIIRTQQGAVTPHQRDKLWTMMTASVVASDLLSKAHGTRHLLIMGDTPSLLDAKMQAQDEGSRLHEQDTANIIRLTADTLEMIGRMQIADPPSPKDRTDENQLRIMLVAKRSITIDASWSQGR